VTKDAVQRRSWTFYEAIIIISLNNPYLSIINGEISEKVALRSSKPFFGNSEAHLSGRAGMKQSQSASFSQR